MFEFLLKYFISDLAALSTLARCNCHFKLSHTHRHHHPTYQQSAMLQLASFSATPTPTNKTTHPRLMYLWTPNPD